MNTIGYENWHSFKFKKGTFLALINKNQVHIFGFGWQNYGAYFSIESFKKHYAKEGEALNLTTAEGGK